MTETFDTIVIGSGCGGAAAAALTSYHGCKTLLLEQSKIIGGRAGTIEKQGFKMDHGHLIARGNKGPHGDVLRIVKCEDLMPEYVAIPSRPITMVALGQKWEYAPGWRHMLGLLSLRKLKAGGFIIRDMPGIIRLLYKIRCMDEDKTKALDQVDLHTFLSKYTDSQAIYSLMGAITAGFFGILPYETSAGEVIRTLNGILDAKLGFGYPVTGEGVSAIPRSFIKAAERYGAEIRTKTPVERIVVEKGEARGVKVRGEFIQAKMIISNAGLKETSFKLVGKNHFQEDYVAYLENLKYGYGGISLKYALDKPIIDFCFGGKSPQNSEMRDVQEGRIPKDTAIMLVCSSNMDPSLAPPGKQLLMAISPGPLIEPGKINWDPWVENLKRQIEEEFVPDISKHTLFCDVYTPDVIARQNGRYYGDAIGVAQSINQVGDKAPSAFSPIKGLYHAGADVGSKGVATEMATESAIDLIEELKRKNLLT